MGDLVVATFPLDRVEFREAAPDAAAGADPDRTFSARIMPWGQVASTINGRESFERGAFADVDPTRVVLRADHEGPPRGRGTSIEERDDGAYMGFETAPTPNGDELLGLVRSKAYRNVSVGFEPIETETREQDAPGGPLLVRRRVRLREVSATWAPAYDDAAIEERNGPTVTTATATEAPPAASVDQIERALARLEAIEERSRQEATAPPNAGQDRALPHKGLWAALAIKSLTGDRVTDVEMRALADVVTGDNLGVVPPAYRSEMLGFINPGRPFLESTRQIPAGATGMKIIMPRLIQRPIVGKQAAEKGDVASQKTIIDTVDFDAETYAGAGDLSLQLLKRSSPEFLALWTELLAEAYGIETDNAALDTLLAEAAVIEGGEFDPANPSFGSAFTNAAAVSKSPLMRPDRIWLSTAAMAAFIDAKTPAGGGGTPVYPGLANIAGIGEGGNTGPAGISLRPVWTPALDDEAVDLIVGPSRGFAWAEDGTYTLQADVPAKAGRDVGLAGIVWFMPLYPAAFTTYTLPVVGP